MYIFILFYYNRLIIENSVTETLIRCEISHITDTEELGLILDRMIPHITVGNYISAINMTLIIEPNSLKLNWKV